MRPKLGDIKVLMSTGKWITIKDFVYHIVFIEDDTIYTCSCPNEVMVDNLYNGDNECIVKSVLLFSDLMKNRLNTSHSKRRPVQYTNLSGKKVTLDMNKVVRIEC